jgi:glycosyltransferase involved in cell wall biosynthesis
MARVSVISIVKDHEAGLRATHESLFEQSYEDWNMIIIVGASSDETLIVAKKLQKFDSRIVLIEQNGSGIYSAMNEGIAAASGEFSWFMNAGDKFASKSTLAHAINQISQTNVGVIIGGYQIESAGQKKTYSYAPRKITGLHFAFNRRGGCHQAMIFQTNILKALGGFNASYSLAADFDLVLKVIQKSEANRVSEIYASIEPGGRSDQGIFLVHNQKGQIRRQLLGGPVVSFASFLWTALARLKIILRRTLKS